MTKPDISESKTAIAKSVDLEPDNIENTTDLPDQQNDRQTAGDIAQRHVGDRGVEHDHERGDGDDDGDQPTTAMLADTFAPKKNVAEQLDEEEAEFRSIRRDLPGAKGASAAGIVTISVGGCGYTRTRKITATRFSRRRRDGSANRSGRN